MIVRWVFAFFICTAASAIGALCGIGGGVVIKPVLDLIGFESAATVSFLSGCTVLAMSAYSILRCGGVKAGLNVEASLPLSLGAALGGVAGKFLFEQVRRTVANDRLVGGIQAGCLAAVTMLTLLYTLRKCKIKTLALKNRMFCVGIGGVLGIVSSFLGIGGGPINIIVLHYFFSMPTKKAAVNSLFMILISQIFGIGFSIATQTVPAFSALNLVFMVLGGVFGGVLGRIWNRRMDNAHVDILFIALMAVIILICVYNMRTLVM